MPSITVRDVPQATRDELAARAARQGRSLQEYLNGLLQDIAAKPDIATAIESIRERKASTGTEIPASTILDHLTSDRR